MRRLLALGLAVVAGGACSDGGGGDVTVAAAASLADAFEQIAAEVEADTDVDVALNLGGSSTLAEQIEQGAPVDVFASADTANMDEVVDAGLVDGDPVVFARNALAVAVRPGNPDGITSLADLSTAAGVVALCGAEVPCGRLADRVLARAGVELPSDRVTRTADVKGALAAVAQSDAVAAIVYVTDLQAAGDAVSGIAIPPDQNERTDYPIAVLADAADGEAARTFVERVRSPQGKAVLESYGFEVP